LSVSPAGTRTTLLEMATSSKDLKKRRKFPPSTFIAPTPALTPPMDKNRAQSSASAAPSKTSTLSTSTTITTKNPARNHDMKGKRRLGGSSVVSRLARAAKEAAEAKQRREAQTNTDDHGVEDDSKQTKYPTRHAGRKTYDDNMYLSDDADTGDLNLSTISILNHVIEDELLRPTDGFKPSRETDSLRLLLEHNNRNGQSKVGAKLETTPKSTKKGSDKIEHAQHLPHQAAMVFARPLIDDQITIEYACRLVSLVKAIKFENYQPEWICFCPSLGNMKGNPKSAESIHTSLGIKRRKNSVSDTAAGIVFFRHLCASNNISLDGIGFCQISEERKPSQSRKHPLSSPDTTYSEHYVDEENPIVDFSSDASSSSWSASSFHPVVESLLHQGYLDRWLNQSTEFESETDEYGMTRDEPRTKIQIHWTLFSSDYDLCNLNDIHIRSPRQSPLGMMVQELEHAVRQKQTFRRGIVQTTWSFQYSIYPYVVYSDTVTSNDGLNSVGTNQDSKLVAFLGKCYLMAQELVPLLVNLRGVAENSEFFQRDNYRRLVKTRRLLATLLEQMNEAYRNNREYKSATMTIPPTLKAQLKKVSTSQTNGNITQFSSAVSKMEAMSSTEIQMESALLSLGRCCDLVRPAGTFSAQSVTRKEWRDALDHLNDFMNRIEAYCDPDQPLPAHHWGVQILEDQPMSRILMSRR
jgi:hypothetical protein